MSATTTWAERFRAGQMPLSECDSLVLAVLARHHLMTTTQLHRLLGAGRTLRQIQRTMAKLAAAGLVMRAPCRWWHALAAWYVTDTGAVAAGDADSRPAEPMTPTRATGRGQQHLLLSNEVGVLWVEALRAAGHECGPLDWEHEVLHRIADRPSPRADCEYLKADLLIRCMLHTDSAAVGMVRFVEVDRATETVMTLFEKVRSYARFLSYRPRGQRRPSWQTLYSRFPKLIVVFDGAAEATLHRRQAALLDLCRDDIVIQPGLPDLGVYTVTVSELAHGGPLAPVFRCPGQAKPVNVLGVG